MRAKNPLHNYTLSGTPICRSRCERDLEILVGFDLRPRYQFIQAKNRAKRILGWISRSESNRSAEIILKLYMALVRLHLDNVVRFWSPYYIMDINILIDAAEDDKNHPRVEKLAL